MSSKIKIAFFDAKDYDMASFDEANKKGDFKIKYFETKLDEDTAKLAKGYDVACVFVNDTVNEKVISSLAKKGVKLIALRCAGFNNVDIKAAEGKIGVVRVPAYSPYAVAEHAAALLLTSIRRIHKSYIRTKDFNFSLNGLMGFDLHAEASANHIDNHKAYVQSWIQAIREKPETLIKAIKDAQAAANYMDWKAGLITDKEYEQTKGAVMEVRQKEREKER